MEKPETRYLSSAESAKLLKKHLKKEFPAVKFSVASPSGRGSVRVAWTDGPTVQRVEKITSLYGGHGFDGMIDMQYSIDAWVLAGEILGTRSRGTTGSLGSVPAWGLIPPHKDAELVHFGMGYLSTERTISPALATRCIAQLCAYWGGVEHPPTAVPGWGGRYTLEPHPDAPRDCFRDRIRPDLDLEWSDAIYQAAGDATRFRRSAWAPSMEVSAEIADAFGLAGYPNVRIIH